MADEVQVAPAVDPNAIKTMIEGAVKTSLEALIKEGAAHQETQRAEQAAAEAAAEAAKQTAANPFQTMVEPAVAPALKAARDAEASASAASDAVNFYLDPANAVAAPYRVKIEQVVAAERKQGRSVSRADAWKWLRGGELYDDLHKTALESHDKQIEEARKASAAGQGTQVPLQFKKPLEQLETKELDEALRDIRF